jgi:hypothetical protein
LLRKIIARHRYTSTVVALLVVIILGFAYTGFCLYRTTRRALDERKASDAQREAAIATLTGLNRQYAFTIFLRACEQGHNRMATSAALCFSKGSKERKAAMFLLNPRPVAEKEPDFRRALSDEHAWFIDFVIGQNHLKNGDKKEALAAYQRSYDAVQQLSEADLQRADGWLAGQVSDRINELSTAGKPDEDDDILQKK